jgi:hypothetical protein
MIEQLYATKADAFEAGKLVGRHIRSTEEKKGTPMDEAKEKQIMALALEAHMAALHCQMLGMVNTAGKTFEEQQQQAVEYALSRARSAEARRALEAAING